ncbi:MAG: hypothetical protein LBC75_10300 [Fibromonadaceae bacterium]|jgi:hypothetical protein|nr:hypothetical protein [Fibromonadaceae bacterium]
MKKILVLSLLCLIFFACDPEVNNSNNETSDLSSSSKRTISSSSEGGSSSSEIRYHPCKPYASKYSMLSKDTLYFNKQGGIDTVVTGIKILFEDFSKKLNYESNEYAYKYLDQCEFSLTDHYSYGNDYSKKTKIESDYCKNNYCDNDDEKSYGNSPFHVPVMKMECPWFSVTQISKDSVQVSVNKNETGKKRSQYIPFTTGGCAISTFDLIIIQTSAP